MKSLLGNCSLVGFKSCLLAILFLLGSTKEAQATDIFVQNFVKASTLLPNYQMLVIGDADFISQATNIQSYDNSIATVAFELNRDTFQSAAAFSMTARFEVTVWYKGSNPNGAGTVLPLFDLTLNHDPVKARVSDYRAFRTFKDVLKISVKVVSVTNTTAHSFIITEEILGNKTYKFDCSKSLGLTYSMNSDSSLMNIQGLIFAGLSVENPDEYEFEWNFYETESELGKRLNLGIATTNEINATFRFNATRVSKTTNSIEIPVLYRFGYIIFRIRASRYLPDGRKEFSKWIASWDKTKGHEQNLNWQSDLTFAEEGKSVATVKYFDGTLRERQAQTYSKANATTIATQTIYDHNGRPAAKTMPLPTLSDTIKYRSTLAMTQGTSGLVAFTKMVFDTINSCSFAPPAMINDGRTYWSRYYSTNNPEKTTLKGSVIPNAEGFHYTMTEFTADNTGRIKKQSGVGATFRMGGTKETQYFYGKPSQEELDRLFGSEVGYASHYQKNMVRDPNDQYSVSYVDAHGRTVATALAGGIPTNLDALVGSNLKPTIKRNILNNVRKGDSLVTSYSLLLPAPSAVKVVYGITKDSFRSGCEPSNICYDCQYDVRIQITEACEGYANPNPNYRKTMTTFAANAVVFDTICSNPPIGLKDSINIASLPQGEYIVTKILKIHRPATDYYAENFVTQSNCKPNLTTLSQQMRATADGAGCFFDCKTCTDSLGTEGQYVTKYLASIGSTTAEDSLAAKYTYVRLLEDCNALCSNYSECGILYKAMLGDVSPGGQYCLDSLDASGNVIPRDGASMLFGLRYQSLLNGEVYRDALGRPDTVEIDGVKKLPTQLNRNEFITYWKPTWAKALVNQHPEYCYWQNCNTTNLCNKFDSTILTIETFAGALAANVIDSAGLFKNDTCFAANGLGFNLKDSLFNWMYINATTDPSGCVNYSGINIVTNAVYANGVTLGKGSTAENDMAWLILRGLYLGYKQKIKSRLILRNCPNSVASCVGTGLSTCAPLGVVTNIYKDKIRRYTSLDTILNPTLTLADLQARYIQDSIAITIEIDSNCSQQADRWLEKLTACNLTPAQQSALRTRLIAVCKKGGDTEHTYGSSTTKGSIATSFGDTSFIQAVNAVLGTSKTICDDCHGNLINYPASYYTPVYVGPRNIRRKADASSCVFTNLTNLKACYDADVTPNKPQFPRWLEKYSDYPLTQKDIDTINVYFNPINTSRYLPYEIKLPPYLECNTCKSCTDIQTLKNQFDATCVNTNNIVYWEKLTRYINNKLGFIRTPEDYFNFITVTCTTSVPAQCTSQRWLCPVSLTDYIPSDTSCVSSLLEQADVQAQIAYDVKLDSLKEDFKARYINRCLQSMETLELTSEVWEYHYTLYYYDQAGNLTKTIPPAGVVLFTTETQFLNVKTARLNNTVLVPAHTLPSVYQYNSLNKVIKQKTPDADTSRFWYDRIGRLVVSQDGRQAAFATKLYSYTQYDNLGRVKEVGEIPTNTVITDLTARTPASLESFYLLGVRQFITNTYYDESYFVSRLQQPLGTSGQDNLRNRVASTTFRRAYSGTDQIYDYGSHYSYDVTGNVKTLVQEISELQVLNQRFKRIDYDYDQLSGKVNAVFYQRDSVDQFAHRYEYDSDNRLTKVYTSRLLNTYYRTNPQGLWWQVEATYDYYKHGPLARMEMGEKRVQGVDYAYTLQGWLKGVNSAYLSSDIDMGQDGLATNATRKLVGRDQYGYILNYYQGDYKGAGTVTFDPDVTAAVATQSGFYKTAANLYNGNIRSMTVAIRQFANSRAYKYKYDQLNRITALDSTWAGTALTTLPSAWTKSLNHAERITYDPNGNIKTYQRYQQTGALMDNLTYTPKPNTNQLQRVNDAVLASTYTTDIDDQPTATNGGVNYEYDGAGNLKKDTSEALNVTWSPYGKVLEAKRFRTAVPAVNISTQYGYDAMQNRVLKLYINGTDSTKTFYIRDAQGNTMAVYTRRKDTLVWAEQHLYGSSRLGTWEPNQRLTPSVDTTKKWHLLEGQKRYELTNHLGNVLVTINDRRQGVTFASGTYAYYEAVTIQATDYYPFGLEMPGRTFQAANTSAYRFGFNDKENDRNGSWSGTQLVQDYGARLYNPAIGRWLSIDPKAYTFPNNSPYCFALNNPIVLVDKDGEVPIVPILLKMASGAASDYLMQVGMNYYFNSETRGSLEKSLEKVDMYQVARSGLEGAIPWRTPGGKLGKAAATATLDVLQQYGKALIKGEDYNSGDAVKDFMTGFIGDLAGGGLGDLVAKYGANSIAKGLQKLGFDQKKIDETFEKAGIKYEGGPAKAPDPTSPGRGATPERPTARSNKQDVGNKGKRKKSTDDFNENLEEIERTVEKLNKRKPSIKDPDDEWFGAKKTPGQKKIDIGKSRQNAKNQNKNPPSKPPQA